MKAALSNHQGACYRAFQHAMVLYSELSLLDRKSTKIEDAHAYFNLSSEAHESLEVLAHTLNNETDTHLFLTGLTSDGRVVTFGASAQRPNHWQLTRFDQQGQPWGDTLYSKKFQGLVEFLSEINLGTLDEIVAMPAPSVKERLST